MAWHDEMKEYEADLRRSFLYSADVVPEQVAAYIKRVGVRGSWDAMDQVLADYTPLITNIAPEFVDYAVDHLVTKPKRGADGSTQYEHEDLDKFGIKSNLDFFPASPTQGPFLPLLNTNEAEGLRLVHALTNAATKRWRIREVVGFGGDRKRTPLPVTIGLPIGARGFWGTAEVYGWFRPNGNGPTAVASALMALEMWMERQVEADRDPEELFARVLAGSESVAAVAVCVAMALAYPPRCLRAMLPLVRTPALWDMDIARRAGDSRPSFAFDPFDSHKLIYALQKERDRRLQRKVDIRSLAYYYTFSDDETLREPFVEGVRGFLDDPPLLTAEARADDRQREIARRRMEEFQCLADRDSFVRQTMPDGRVAIYPRQPPHIQARLDEELAPVRERNRWLGVAHWADETIENNRVADGMTLDEAVEAARSLARSDDFTAAYAAGGAFEQIRRQAVVSIAAAVTLVGYEWAREGREHGEQEPLAWCRRILSDAASATSLRDAFDSRERALPSNPKVTAALGIGALVGRGTADMEERKRLLRLVADPHLQEVEGVFRGLAAAWSVDPVLCWNCFDLALQLATRPRRNKPDFDDPEWDGVREAEAYRERERRRVSEALDAHISNLERSVIPPAPSIEPSEEDDFLWDLAQRALKDMPVAELSRDSDSKARLLAILDGLLALTVACNSPDEDDRDRNTRPLHLHVWNHFLFEWATRLSGSLSLDEIRRHLFAPVRACWSSIPHLTATLLHQYAIGVLSFVEPPSPDALAGWREVCMWVLESPEAKSRAALYDSGVYDAIGILIFISNGRMLVTDRWRHAGSFAEIIGGYVRVVGHALRHFSRLLTMLLAFRRDLEPRMIIGWLSSCAGRAADVGAFFREQENGTRTAELLQQVWYAAAAKIRSDADTLERYSRLVDGLVDVGVPLASVLQQRLEQDPV